MFAHSAVLLLRLLLTRCLFVINCGPFQDHTLDSLGPRYAVAFDEVTALPATGATFLNHVRLQKHSAANIYPALVLS